MTTRTTSTRAERPVTFAGLGSQRLLKLAAYLDTADAEHRAAGESLYNQASYGHSKEHNGHVCNSPACALGHYAYMERRRRNCPFRWSHSSGYWFDGWWYQSLKQEFCIDSEEGFELFSACGCHGARTAKQAARYIRRFVARKLKALKAAGVPA